MIFERLTVVSDTQPHGAALNMAIDEHLLREASGPLLRVYRWARPAVSFGYFGALAEAVRAAPDREPVRRWTGGGIVLHGEDLTYTIIAPRSHPFGGADLRESYRLIHHAVAAVLAETGTSAQLATPAFARVSEECFENAVEYDVIAGGMKLAGAAQRRTRWGLLHQGSVQRFGDRETFAEQLATRLAARTISRDLSSTEIVVAAELERTKYGTAEWLARK